MRLSTTLAAVAIGAGLAQAGAANPPDVNLSEVASLMATGVDNLDAIDMPLAIWGDLAVIGAPSAGEHESGLAYVYRHTGLDWARVARLVASDGARGDHFGESVAIDADTIVVGAPGDDHDGPDTGCVYVFRNEGRHWVEETKLVPRDHTEPVHTDESISPTHAIGTTGLVNPDSVTTTTSSPHRQRHIAAGDRSDEWTGAGPFAQGTMVAVSGGTILIGSSFDDEAGHHIGPVHVYRESGDGWIEHRNLIEIAASDQPSSYGMSIGLAGDTAAIGYYPLSTNDKNPGVVKVFVFQGDNWNTSVTLRPQDPIAGEQFARHVSVADSMILVGATDRDEQGNSTGSAYVFRRDGQRWFEEARLVPTFPFPGVRSDFMEVISQSTVVMGSRWAKDGKRKFGVGKVFTLKSDAWAEDAGVSQVITNLDEMKSRR